MYKKIASRGEAGKKLTCNKTQQNTEEEKSNWRSAEMGGPGCVEQSVMRLLVTSRIDKSRETGKRSEVRGEGESEGSCRKGAGEATRGRRRLPWRGRRCH